MVRVFSVLRVALTCLIAFVGYHSAQADDYLETRARQAIIVDYESGVTLFAKDADTPIMPASMSKLMTAAVVLDQIDRGQISLRSKFNVSEKAWRTGGSKMFVLVDTEIAVEDLLKGLLVHSGNDAAIVLAENISGSEEAFVDLMNRKAAEWGLEQSTFVNPTGLPDPDQLMSVRDLATLTSHIWREYRDYRYLFGIAEFEWSDILQKNRNPLLASFDGADGMKTGYTDDAGWGLVGTAERNGDRRIIVVAGLADERARGREADRMMSLAFSEYETRTFFDVGDIVGTADVFGGRSDTLPLRIDVPVRFTRHKRALDTAQAKVVYDGPLLAPIREGQQVAILEVTIRNEGTSQFPLYAAERVGGLGPLAKISLGLKVLFTPPDTAE